MPFYGYGFGTYAANYTFKEILEKLSAENSDKDLIGRVVEKVKDLEGKGFTFEAADASFELLLREEATGKRPSFFTIDHWLTTTERDTNNSIITKAEVTVTAQGKEITCSGAGNGPVNAFDNALRDGLNQLYPELASASTLKPEVVAGLDIMIVRELTGDIYFGQPRGISTLPNGEREGVNTMRYSESEIRRIGHVAFSIAMKRNKKVCSVDKANVLETTELWRQVMIEISKEYPEVELSHMYVDNAAMQLIRAPKQFDVMVTGNIFGDILSDEASMLTGSIGMLPSASLDANNKGMYEPSHGSAPDIANQDIANPLATILSAAMMLRYSFNDEANALRIENAVKKALAQGYRTADIYTEGAKKVKCSEMGDAVVAAL